MARKTNKPTKRAKKTVRGPQLKLPMRTPRLRYVESPTKKGGNPFFALRVPAGLLRAFKAHAKKKDTEATAMVRAFMSKVTGIELEADGAE